MKKLEPASHNSSKGHHARAQAILICLGVFAFVAGLPGVGLAAPRVVQICHYPPDNPSNRRILTVGKSSLPDHLSHGDNVLGEEVCDLVDNDCDGLVDEDENGDPLINPTTCGVGDCAGNTGFETCENGAFVNDTCDPFDGASGEFCDGRDNDCDGSDDEDSDLCGLGYICDGGAGCIIDPTLTCPCDADLDAGHWDDGSIGFGGCITDAGDGFPQIGLISQLYGGPATISFILDSGDVDADGIRDYTCVVGESDDGIGGNPPVWSPTRPVDEQDLLGCAVRLSSAPIPVLDCIVP